MARLPSVPSPQPNCLLYTPEQVATPDGDRSPGGMGGGGGGGGGDGGGRGGQTGVPGRFMDHAPVMVKRVSAPKRNMRTETKVRMSMKGAAFAIRKLMNAYA